MGGSAARCDSEVSAVPEQDPSTGQTFRAESCSFMQSRVLHPEEEIVSIICVLHQLQSDAHKEAQTSALSPSGRLQHTS